MMSGYLGHARRRPAQTLSYVVIRCGDHWSVGAVACKAGCFDSEAAAEDAARRLAREAAALGHDVEVVDGRRRVTRIQGRRAA